MTHTEILFLQVSAFNQVSTFLLSAINVSILHAQGGFCNSVLVGVSWLTHIIVLCNGIIMYILVINVT